MTYNPMNLEGKIILITGASSGISRAIAVEWSKLGAQCILTARHDQRRAPSWQKGLTAAAWLVKPT